MKWIRQNQEAWGSLRGKEPAKKVRIPIHGNCERCGLWNDGTFQTGRFCSKKCAYNRDHHPNCQKGRYKLGSKGRPGYQRSNDELFINGEKRSTGGLKYRILQENIYPLKCAICGITEWCNQPTPLELDHINGDKLNNTLENLRLLCPNCHAQTDTYAGRKFKKNKKYELNLQF